MLQKSVEFSLSKISGLHIITMSTLALAHPLYSVLGHADHAPFFIAHESKAIDIYLLVLSLSVLLPLTLCAVLWLINLLSTTLARGFYVLLLFILMAAFFLPIFGRLPAEMSGVTIPLALTLALLATVLYIARDWARTFVTWMSVAVVLSPALFLNGATMKSFLASAEARDYTIITRTSKLPNVVMIIFDELPLISLLDENREIDGVRYPNFHRLAETATWYRNTTSIHYATSGATSSLLVGGEFDRYLKNVHPNAVPASGAMDRAKVPSSLFSLLENDYLVFAVELVSKLARESEESSEYEPPLTERMAELAVDASVVYSHVVTPIRFRGRLPVIEGQWRNFLAANTAPSMSSEWRYVDSYKRLSRVKQFIDSLEKRNRPSFYFLHSLLPHFPFAFNEHGQIHASKFSFLTMHFRKATGSNDWPNETAVNLAYQAHLLQLGFTDVLLGRILDKLAEQDLFEESLIVVTSDHGTSFYWDTADLPDERLAEVQASGTMYVPLIIKLPGQSRGKISDRPVKTIDIVPTIADILKLEISWEVEGVSALSNAPPKAETYAYLPGHMKFGAEVDPELLALKRKIELFGTRNLDRIYRLGPHREMVGKPVTSFAKSASTGTVKVKRPEQYRSIDPSGPRVPAYIEGEINLSDKMTPSELSVAIAVNGVIRGTMKTTSVAISALRPENRTPSKPLDGDDEMEARSGPFHFLVRLPPESYVKGSNKVAVYAVVEGEQGAPVSLIDLNQN